MGEREVRALLPVSSIGEMENYADLMAQGILRSFLSTGKLGTHAFNMAIFFGKTAMIMDFAHSVP